jgi:hypothetical protein
LVILNIATVPDEMQLSAIGAVLLTLPKARILWEHRPRIPRIVLEVWESFGAGPPDGLSRRLDSGVRGAMGRAA